MLSAHDHAGLVARRGSIAGRAQISHYSTPIVKEEQTCNDTGAASNLMQRRASTRLGISKHAAEQRRSAFLYADGNNITLIQEPRSKSTAVNDAVHYVLFSATTKIRYCDLRTMYLSMKYL